MITSSDILSYAQFFVVSIPLAQGAIQQDGESIVVSYIGEHRRSEVNPAFTWVLLLVFHVSVRNCW